MAAIDKLPTSQVVRLVADADPREFSLFLGAGASYSSGIPLAGQMIDEWRQMMIEDRAPPGADAQAWLREQSWYEADDEYSVLFETLYPNERARQRYVEPRIEQGFPNWGYLYLANLVEAGYFNVIFTTNFDDLVNEALSLYLGYNPVVCAAESEVETINIASTRAKIVKLHGDYLFKRLRNTVDELAELDPVVEAKFGEFSRRCGMLVIGYAGRDRSVMRAIARTLEDPTAFPTGIWWGLHPAETPSSLVAELADVHAARFKLFECADFDAFMVALHSRRELELPDTVVRPYESVEERFSRLIGEVDSGHFADATIRAHVDQLKKELSRPWAKASEAGSDLFEARLAIGKRDYRTALALIEGIGEKAATSADALTAWGDALAIRAEEEHDRGAGEAAVEKWRDAIAVDPGELQARYSLARYFHRLQKFREAIEPAEAIAGLAPNDTGAQRSLVQLYAATGRTADAASLIEQMLVVEPDAADLHAMLAQVCEARGLIAAGLVSIRRAVELDGSNPYYRFMLANGLARAGRLGDAGDAYLAAIELDPGNLGFRLGAAQFLTMRGAPERAADQLREAVRIEPKSAEAQGLLGELHLMQGQLGEAQTHIDAALRLSPDDSRLLVNAGTVALRSGRYDDAAQTYRRAATLNPQQPQPLYWLTLVDWSQNRDAESQASLGSLGAIAPQVAGQLATQLQMMNQQCMGLPGRRAAVLNNWLNASGQQPPAGEASLTDQLKSAVSRWLNT